MLRLSNQDARRLFLHKHALAEQPTGPGKGSDLLELITRLGFVQVDSVRTVERAHHMILYARRPAYRPRHLAQLLEKDRSLFEHWTHDASVIPTAFYPYWQLRFERNDTQLRKRWRAWQRDGFEDKLQDVLHHIGTHGACGTGDVGTDEKRSSGGWWEWHPSKTALEFLWQTGHIAISRRDQFRKIFDLSAHVIPADALNRRPGSDESVDWLCNNALDRLGFATSGEIAAFWATISAAEARDWCAKQLEIGTLIEVDITGADGSLRKSFARPDIEDQIAASPTPPGRLRILSPFDPALRDRKRAERLFGFHYRIEIFTPAEKREYGYYVYPMLEGDRLVGRIDVSADRPNDRLLVTALWPERGVRWGDGRHARLVSELNRLAKFSGLSSVSFGDSWLRAPK